MGLSSLLLHTRIKFDINLSHTNKTNMTLFSTLIVACSLSSLVLSGNYDKDNHRPTEKKMHKTPRPTKWSPPSYEKEREWMKNWEKPTADIDEPTYEKEPAYLSWGQNPYNNRERRSQMKAQLEEQIESGKQELAALDALEIDVSEEQDEEEGMEQAASTNGNAGFFQP